MRFTTSILVIYLSNSVSDAFSSNTLQTGNLPVYQSSYYSGSVSSSQLNIFDRGYDDEDDDGDWTVTLKKATKTKAPKRTFGSENVPDGQIPANEYLDLVSSPMFDWASEEKGNVGLTLRLGVVYLFFYFGICYPISGATFTMDGYEAHKIASSNIGVFGVLLALMIRLYTGWGYIGSRLKSEYIEYEETGWYDGDVEMKTKTEQSRDLLLYREDVEPVENRLRLFALGTGAAFIASCVSYNIILKDKPLFNQYDADMLERLRYDDKVSKMSQQQSDGRPTYCNSRYYQAIANGGQGC